MNKDNEKKLSKEILNSLEEACIRPLPENIKKLTGLEYANEEDSLEKLNRDMFERYFSKELEKEATEAIKNTNKERRDCFGLSDEFFKNAYKSSVVKMEFKEREERLLNKSIEREEKAREEERKRLKEEKERIKEEFKRNRKNKK